MSCSIFIAFGKSTASEPEQILGTPKTDQLPGQKVIDRLVALRGHQGHILHFGARSNAPANVATLMRRSWPNALDEKPG